MEDVREEAGTRRGGGPGNVVLRVLVGTASLVVIVAGLRAIRGFLLPILVALFVTVLCMGPLGWLRARGVPRWLSIVLVMIVAFLVMDLLVVIVGGAVTDFRDSLPKYEQRMGEVVQDGLQWLESIGVDVPDDGPPEAFSAGNLTRLLSGLLQQVLALLSNVFVILLIVIFMLMETSDLPTKIRNAMGDPENDLEVFHRARESIYNYVYIKTAMSLLTGILWGAFTAFMGLDFPVLWGLLAFLLNYIPNIGSLLAAVPPILLALLQFDVQTAALVALGNIVINQAIGSGLEPRLMGKKVGLSPLVVFLSLLFWSWLWGPVGMILSVPLTMVVKLICEESPDLRPVAILLGPAGGGPRPPPPK
ncbi:MAG: AI-2E family transporter [Planctomycetota bacterium]|jgi:predicted PurR-regulated permease PerM